MSGGVIALYSSPTVTRDPGIAGIHQVLQDGIYLLDFLVLLYLYLGGARRVEWLKY